MKTKTPEPIINFDDPEIQKEVAGMSRKVLSGEGDTKEFRQRARAIQRAFGKWIDKLERGIK